MTKQRGHPFRLFLFRFNSVHIPHSLENITDAKISLRKVPFRLLLAGAAVKNPSHSSNRSDLFYGTGYTVNSQKVFTRQLTNVLIPTNTILHKFSVHSMF